MSFKLITIAVRDDGCYSVMLQDGQPFAVTNERTFEDGKPVLKAGRYKCKKTIFHRGGYPTYEIIVEGHTRVLFHIGNKETDSVACVLVAENFAVARGVTMVGSSADGFKEFMSRAGGVEEFELEIEDGSAPRS